MRKVYEIFKKNLELAERILFITEIKGRLDEFPRVFSGPLGQIRDFLSGRADEVFDVAKPLLLVFTTSCLEHYLKSVREKKNLAQMIDDWKDVAGDRLARDMHEMRIKRNIIIHNAQLIDEKKERALKKYGIKGYSRGERLELSIGEVREFLSEAKKFVEIIEKARGRSLIKEL